MIRFRGVSLPGFGLGFIIGGSLLVTQAWHPLDLWSIGAVALATWLVTDIAAVVSIARDKK